MSGELSSEDVEVTQEFEHVSVMRIEPGDVLIFRSKVRLSGEIAKRIVDRLEETFPGHRALVLDDDAELAVGRVA